MAHEHAAHSPGVSPDADRRRLAVALGLIVAFMAVEVAGRRRRALARAALRRRTHAHRRRHDRLLAGRAAPGRASARRRDDVRPQARGDPLRPGQRRDAADARGVHRLRGRPPPVRPARTCAAGWCWRSRSLGVLVNLAAVWTLVARQPPQPQHRGQLPAHPDRPVWLHRHRDRRRGDPGERLRARRPDRLAAGRRADDPLGRARS